MPDTPAYPSPFYALVENGLEYALRFPCNEDGAGPCLLENGEIDAGQGTEQSEESILAIPLGNGRYRLAERSDGPFSGLCIDWGDEFMATEIHPGVLLFERLILSRRFAHWHIIGPGGFSNDHPYAELLHRFGGGWESIAGGMMTFSVPVEHTAALVAEANRLRVHPKGISL